jgi:hypothetical protein
MKHRKILIMSNIAIIAYYAAFLLYCIVAACTLVAVMGMTHWWELLMYVPHLIILVLAMILVSHRIDSKVKS